MDNIGYEEFPKLTNEGDITSEDRDRETEVADEENGRCSPLPPTYTPSMEPAYPQEPPPRYSQTSACQLPMYTLTPFQPYPHSSSTATLDGNVHDHFGVLIDPTGLPPPVVVTEPPADYLAPSIFNLLFCCIVFGLFGLVKSISTRAAIQVGDYELAYIHAIEARNWNIAASVTGGILWALAIVALVVVFTV